MPAPPIAEMLRLPLVERELIAAANRRRTYTRRCISLGGLLFIYLLVQLSEIGMGRGGQMQALGMGYVYSAVLFITCALMTGSAVLQQCTGCIAAEKEGGTLPLLLLTPLGPRRLVVQKWLSQLVDAGTLALLALPLLVVGYTFGGIALAKVAAYACALVLLILHAGALGVLASSIAATVRGAGTVAMLLAVLLYAPVLIGAGVLFHAPVVHTHLAMLMVDLTPIGVILMAAGTATVPYQPAWLWWLAACVLPLFPVTLMLLWAGRALARWREKPAALALQGRLRAASGDERGLPQDQGMAWLAWKQSFLSRTLSRLGLPLVVGLLLLADLGVFLHVVTADARAIALLLFALGAFTLASSCAGVLPIERLRQTLEIMLTTPCSAEGMVAQLHRLHRRLMRWILAALVFALLIAAFHRGGMLDAIRHSRISGGDPTSLLLCLALVVVVLVSMRNCLALIIPCALMNGAAMVSPSSARAAAMSHVLFLLALSPIVVFFLVLLLGLLVGVLSADALHDQSWMPLAQNLSACVSPLVLIWACLLYPESVDHFLYLPLLLALPILHAGAVAWLDRRLGPRAAERLRHPALAASAA